MVGTDKNTLTAALSETTKGGIDRRTLIKRAAATSAVVWSAPMVLSSASPAAAGTPEQLGPKCFRFMYNWRWAQAIIDCSDPGSDFASQNNPADNCAQSFNENDPKQNVTSNACCRETVNFDGTNDATMAATCQSGNVKEWYQLADIPPFCVKVTETQPCANSGTGGMTVTFEMDEAACSNCWMHDFLVAYSDDGDVLTTNPNDCSNIGTSTSNIGGSVTYRKAVFHFTGNNVPVWFKFFIMCDLTRQSESSFGGCSDNVPNTQNDCLLPGSAQPSGDNGGVLTRTVA